MKYLKRFNEELTPKVYQRAAKGILDRQEIRKKHGLSTSKWEQEKAEKSAKELEEFAEERGKNYDPKTKTYNLNKNSKYGQDETEDFD